MYALGGTSLEVHMSVKQYSSFVVFEQVRNLCFQLSISRYSYDKKQSDTCQACEL